MLTKEALATKKKNSKLMLIRFSHNFSFGFANDIQQSSVIDMQDAVNYTL